MNIGYIIRAIISKEGNTNAHAKLGNILYILGELEELGDYTIYVSCSDASGSYYFYVDNHSYQVYRTKLAAEDALHKLNRLRHYQDQWIRHNNNFHVVERIEIIEIITDPIYFLALSEEQQSEYLLQRLKK